MRSCGDVLEEGVGNLRLDEEGIALDRRAHTAEQKKLYKKHHLIRGILVVALPHKEYLKMSDKSTTKAMFTLLEQGCFTSHLLSFDNNKVLKIFNWIC